MKYAPSCYMMDVPLEAPGSQILVENWALQLHVGIYVVVYRECNAEKPAPSCLWLGSLLFLHPAASYTPRGLTHVHVNIPCTHPAHTSILHSHTPTATPSA